MPACPAGHESGATDWCDVCGAPMSAPAAPSATPAAAPSAAPAAAPAPSVSTCVVCGAERDGRFCESCGHDSALPAPAPVPAPVADSAVWVAVVRADKAWFDEVRGREGPDAAALQFPAYCPERRFTLDGEQMSIGRLSRSRGIVPDIDLSGPPLDPGVSALHAVLVRGPAGWQVVDLDSTNGTVVGGRMITPNTPVGVADGDVIKVGAWTTISLSSRGG